MLSLIELKGGHKIELNNKDPNDFHVTSCLC